MNAASQNKTFLNQPISVYLLSFAELWERFSYYGMRALLVLFMAHELRYDDTRIYAIFGTYATLVYAAPVIGGYLADKVIGFQRAIMLGSIVIISGHLCMAIPMGESFFYLGLALVVAGTGLFKSNVSSLVGLQYDIRDQRKDAGFTIFYIGINIGGILAPLCCDYVGRHYGWHYGFGLASIGMLIGAIVLFKFRSHLGTTGLAPSEPVNNVKANTKWVATCAYLLTPIIAWVIFLGDEFMKFFPFLGILFLAYILIQAFSRSLEQRRNILLIIGVMIVLMLSGSLVEQVATLFTLFLDRNVDRFILGWEMPVPYFQSIDPCIVLIFGGVISQIWMRLAKKGKDLAAGSKFIIAFTILTIAYALLYLNSMPNEVSLMPVYVVICALALLSLADIFIYPISLSVCSQLAPSNLQGLMMGGVMMSVAFSQYLANSLAKIASVPEEIITGANKAESLSIYNSAFMKMTGICLAFLCIAIIFGIVSRKYLKGEALGSEA